MGGGRTDGRRLPTSRRKENDEIRKVLWRPHGRGSARELIIRANMEAGKTNLDASSEVKVRARANTLEKAQVASKVRPNNAKKSEAKGLFVEIAIEKFH